MSNKELHTQNTMISMLNLNGLVLPYTSSVVLQNNVLFESCNFKEIEIIGNKKR